jgi:hypothetical protein
MSGFLTPPAQVAYRHREARDGVEVACFGSRENGASVDGHTAAVEAGEAWSARYAIEVDAEWVTVRAHVQERSRGDERALILEYPRLATRLA